MVKLIINVKSYRFNLIYRDVERALLLRNLSTSRFPRGIKILATQEGRYSMETHMQI